MQFLNLTSGQEFSMGKGRNWRVVHPDMGAAWITLNHGLHEAGNEFVQHVHDDCDDVIVVLEGAVSLRQGDSYTQAEAGEALMIPAGEVHGTLNSGGRQARMVSFQSPPDKALYSGERNKAEGERPRPVRDHVSHVLVVRMSSGGPDFRKDCDWRQVFGPHNGSQRMLLEYGRFEPGQALELIEAGRESLLIVPGGAFELERVGAAARNLAKADVVFLHRGEACRLVCSSPGSSLIYCSALGGELPA
jgi:mannose-6-phosphate isomerase-like protein (cupin superfamily)